MIIFARGFIDDFLLIFFCGQFGSFFLGDSVWFGNVSSGPFDTKTFLHVLRK